MEKCLFIYNPQSGKCKIKEKEDYIVKRLNEKYDTEVVRSAYAGNIGDTIKARGEEFSLVVGAGGDGTINEIIDAVMHLEKKPIIGYIPAGTCNDLAHSLYIPQKIDKALDNILNGTVYQHDVMKINDKFGIYVCCGGLFTSTSYATDQSVKKRMGRVAYFINGAKSIFNTKAINVQLAYGEGNIEGKYAIFLINNSRYTAGMKIHKEASLNDGLVDVMLIESKKDKINLSTVIKVAFMFLRGIEKYYGKRGVQHLQLASFDVALDNDCIVNLDGEKLTTGNIKVEVVKEGVSIIVPKINKLVKNIKNIK